MQAVPGRRRTMSGSDAPADRVRPKGGNLDSKHELLRHTVATVAYRARKPLAGAPPDFGQFRPGPTSRRAGEILAHAGDLFDWALSMAAGRPAWKDSAPLPWVEEVAR